MQRHPRCVKGLLLVITTSNASSLHPAAVRRPYSCPILSCLQILQQEHSVISRRDFSWSSLISHRKRLFIAAMPFRQRFRRLLGGFSSREDHSSVQHESVRRDGQDEAAGTSTLPVTTSIASSAPTGLPERLWDRAYDKLKDRDSALIEAYEKILSRKLGGQGFDTPVTASEQNIIAQNDTRARRSQMRKLIQDGLGKTSGEAKIKQAIGAVLSAKDMISAAIQAVPQAALAWTGVCVALEVNLQKRSGFEFLR